MPDNTFSYESYSILCNLSSSCVKVWFTNFCLNLATQSGLDKRIHFRGIWRMVSTRVPCSHLWKGSHRVSSDKAGKDILSSVDAVHGMIGCLIWKLAWSYPMWSPFVPLWSHDRNTILRLNALGNLAVAQRTLSKTQAVTAMSKFEKSKSYWTLSKQFNN